MQAYYNSINKSNFRFDFSQRSEKFINDQILEIKLLLLEVELYYKLEELGVVVPIHNDKILNEFSIIHNKFCRSKTQFDNRRLNIVCESIDNRIKNRKCVASKSISRYNRKYIVDFYDNELITVTLPWVKLKPIISGRSLDDQFICDYYRLPSDIHEQVERFLRLRCFL